MLKNKKNKIITLIFVLALLAWYITWVSIGLL